MTMTLNALIDAIVSEALYQNVLQEREGVANLVSRLTLLLQNRGLDSSRSLFMTVMQAEVEAKPQAKAELLERAIHNAEATQQLKRIGERSILLRRPRPN